MFKSIVFTNTLKWDGGQKGTLSRNNNVQIEVSTPAEFKGLEGYWSPEELFLASINSCIMTTFLYFAQKFSVPFLSYESGIEGRVDLKGGKLLFTSITVRAYIRVSDKSRARKIAEVVEKSEKYCLVSSSVDTEIEVLPAIRAGPSQA